jgi:ABC-type amino acid transport system permease subunit
MGGAVLGSFLRDVLPKEHISDESRDIVKVALGLIATLAALVLGLLVATASSSLDTKVQEVQQAAAKIILMDHNLRQFGPQGSEARNHLRQSVIAAMRASPSSAKAATPGLPLAAAIEQFQHQLRMLSPTNEEQRLLRMRLVQLGQEVAQTHWLLVEQGESSIRTPLLVVLIFWLTVLFAGLSLLSPRNKTVTAVAVLCALSVSSAIFLVLEMDRPFDGLFRISDEPLKNALAELNR